MEHRDQIAGTACQSQAAGSQALPWYTLLIIAGLMVVITSRLYVLTAMPSPFTEATGYPYAIIALLALLAALGVLVAQQSLRHLRQRERELTFSRGELQRHLHEIAALEATGRELNSSLELPQILATISVSTRRHLRAAEVQTLLYDSQTRQLQDALGSVFDEGMHGNLWRAAMQVAQTGKPLVVADVAHHPLFAGTRFEISDESPSVSLVVHPLTCSGRTQGVLIASFDRPWTPGKLEHLTLAILAGQAAIAIENARAYQKVLAEQAKVRAIVEGTSDGILLVRHDGQITFANRAARALLEPPDGTVEGKQCQGLIGCYGKDGRPLCGEMMCPLRRVLQGSETSVVQEARLANEAGEEVWMEVRCSRLQRVDGGSAQVLCLLHDVSEKRQLDQMKSEFIASVSHELRAPLTIMQGYSEILMRPDLTVEDPMYYARVINDEARHLSSLVDDLLDFSRVETGRLRLLLDWTDLGEVVADVLRSFKGSSNRHTFSYRSSPTVPMILADARRIRQVLTNLVSNALKYSPEGGLVEIELRPTSDPTPGLCLSVSDEGPGIPPEEQSLIFERFYRRPEHRNSVAGVGLGLAVSKAIVEGHGGRIWVESEPGKGSTFRVFLPFEAGEPDMVPESEPTMQAG
ncbi:MAG TPA: sensor histidine kinase [Anaerolineae bacterium]|nr:sensor histidine kinase [Anaerolineae bacterium]